ncbi:glycosyl transferase, group 1 family protein [Verrucomicrobiia bacterium DG1235]|nr:glycosyl transferase, group 1 family protein [Verrucomicrobiae bacterium DG1235]
MKKLKILIAGPLPPPIGGSLIVFEKLTRHLSSAHDFICHTLNTRPRTSKKKNLPSELFLAFRLFSVFAIKGPNVDCLSFHASRGAFIKTAPIIYIISRLLGKPLILRIFGGGLLDQYKKNPKHAQIIFRHTTKHAENILVQTRSLKKTFEQLGYNNITWYPNSIPTKRAAKIPKGGSCKSFVYLGRITENKGIKYLLDAFKRLPDCELTIYGPIDDSDISTETLKGGNIHYAGIAERESIDEVLSAYDALILPTFHPGEGYPGVVLQAYNQGLPVIATNWMAIPEIVSKRTGILIPPKSTEAIVSSVKTLSKNPDHYTLISENALKYSRQFSDTKSFTHFQEILRSLVKDKNNSII